MLPTIDFIIGNLGFAPWIRKGQSMTGKNAQDLSAGGGWTGASATDNSAYKLLNHKWIYMYGDSTTRQIWASYGAPFKGNNFERNAKEFTRHYCSKQSHRKHHVKGGSFDDEGWRGPCGVNEVKI